MKNILIGIILFYTLIPCFSDGWVVIANFSEDLIDIRIGEQEQNIATLNDLKHTEISEPIKFNQIENYEVFFRQNSKIWLSVTNDLGVKAKYNFGQGEYIIVAGMQGIPNIIKLEKTKKHNENASVYILNETGRTINRFLITDDWEYGTEGLFLEDIQSGIPSGPHFISEGTYKIMWNFVDDSHSSRYFALPEEQKKVKANKRIFCILYRHDQTENTYLIEF